MGVLDPQTSPLVSEFNKPPAAAPAAAPTPPKPDKPEQQQQQQQQPKELPPSNVVQFPQPTGGAGVQDAMKDIAQREKYRATIQPPKLERPEKKNTATDDIQLWGSLAIAFAGFASLRTRAPMTSALNAAAAALNGMHEGSKERTDQAYKQWEQDTRFAIETAQFEQRAYDELMNQISTREALRYKAGQEQDTATWRQETLGFKEHQADTTNAFKREDLTRKENEGAAKIDLEAGKLGETEKRTNIEQQKADDSKAHRDASATKEGEQAEVAFQTKDPAEKQAAMLKLKTTAAAMHDDVLLQVIAQGEKEGGPDEGLKRAVDFLGKRQEQTQKLKGQSAAVIHLMMEKDLTDKMRASPAWKEAEQKGDVSAMLAMTAQVESALKGKTGKDIPSWPPALIDATAKKIVDGKQAPLTGSNLFGRGAANNPNIAAIQQKVNELDPDYDSTMWTAKQQAVKSLLGKDGDQIRSFTVLVHHLEFFDELAKELRNSPDRPQNEVINYVARQFGMPEVTNFDTAKLIVGQEILKATSGSTETGEDRARIAEALDKANSPEQLAQVSNVIRKLASGQLSGQLSKYRKLIDKGWLTDSDVVPQDAMDRLGFTHTKSGSVLKPGGEKSLLDPDRGWVVEKTGTSIPDPAAPMSEKADLKEIPKEQAVKEAPKGMTHMRPMKNGGWAYSASESGPWVDKDGKDLGR